MYNKVTTDLNFTEREKEIEKFWRENRIFEKSIENRKQGETYTFYDGPPTANGKPHIGHVLTRVIKDMVPRYQTMKGKKVLRKAGWDTHGLPVELEVEKKLGLDGKDQIEKYGLIPFINECKESVWKYKGMWEDFSRTVGFWADMENPYVTYHNNYIESEWWALKQIYEKGLLYKGFKIVPYCPRCGTPLSSHEVAQGYKDVKEKSAIAKFPVEGENNTFYLAWTTTPWTLPSNVALCVNKNVDYVKVKAESGEYFILAKALCESVLKGGYEIVGEFKGTELERKRYIPLYDFDKVGEKAFYITCDDYVTISDGTGIVHIAPAFGEDDNRVGKKYGLPFVQMVGSKGEMKEKTPWAGMFCKDADKEVFYDLKTRGLLYASLPFEHSYPFCWRCDTPLIYYARDSWFIKMTDVKDKLIANNETINWIPETIGKGRFGEWLRNVQDWSISRDRYWGTPLNIWECECGHRHSIGSIAELKSMSDNCPDDIELHKPYIDAVTIKCPKCGGQMKRTKEVIDCWFDSGAMPFAQWHYPFENKEIFDDNFPADFISEALDQTRGWFYSLLAISTLIFDRAPYKNVIVLGLVQDENGQKMSKSKGNAVDPFDALKKHGADAIRWYFYSNSAPWLPNRFYDAAVTEGQRTFMGTLWNTYAFFVLYANIDNFDAAKHKLDESKMRVLDKWIISKLNTLTKVVDEYLGDYKITEAARALNSFVDELSNWYVRLSRERFWSSELTDDKTAAYMTLYTVLVTLSKLCAPMTPFMSESIYRNLVCSINPAAPESVHLCDYPVFDESKIDKPLEDKMEEVGEIVTLGRACRNAAAIKNRQPLSRMFVGAENELPEFYRDIILSELNIKSLEFTSEVGKYINYSFKPQLKTLGPKLGKSIGELKNLLAAIDGKAAMAELDATGYLKVKLSDGEKQIAKEDLLIERAKVDGFIADSDHGITVVLDTTLNEELIEEGYVREVISKLQTMRKEAGFEVMDNIAVFAVCDAMLCGIIAKNKSQIMHDTLAKSIELVPSLPEETGYAKDWSINGTPCSLSVKKL